MTDPDSEALRASAEDVDASPADYALGPMMVVMAWREGDTASTIDDALRDGPANVGEIAAEVADARGLPRDWLKQLGHVLAEPPPADTT